MRDQSCRTAKVLDIRPLGLLCCVSNPRRGRSASSAAREGELAGRWRHVTGSKLSDAALAC
eukprot:2277216-Rhodomonas_salina.3